MTESLQNKFQELNPQMKKLVHAKKKLLKVKIPTRLTNKNIEEPKITNEISTNNINETAKAYREDKMILACEYK
ncbi:19121_t:CDS:2, partial [Dentiscutata erythropus]